MKRLHAEGGGLYTAINAIDRLIQYGGARGVLFLVDRSNLATQAEKEFQGYWAPEVNRKFTELCNVLRLSSNTIMDSSQWNRSIAGWREPG
ncbi:MAG: DEAD/DEAH box helicase family protein [Synechococcaceae cyanobacterium]|nr:DEAD/DEAH box helicase family protein [Synechococcaceae cyanobacterium]